MDEILERYERVTSQFSDRRLARATGYETLDGDQVQRMLAATGEMPEEALRSDGMFGPAIEVPADSDDQTELLAYLGRRA
jgi:hypothetical protein